jgi:hypothetical protein
MLDAKFLELVCSDAKCYDFYYKYAKGRQESEGQSIRLSNIASANQNWHQRDEQAKKVRT